MKYHQLLLTILSVAALGVGCKPAASTSDLENRDAAAAQLEKLKKDARATAQDIQDYSYTQKSEFVEKMQKQLAEINRNLDELSAKVEKSSDTAKAEAKPKLEGLRNQTGKLNKQLEEVKNATESTWNDVKAGFKKGYAELKEGFQQARQWVSDKIAP